MLYVDLSGKIEFGNTISLGLWYPYICRNGDTNNKIGVYSRIPFEKEWTKEWFDDFIFIKKPIHKIGKNKSTESLYIDKGHVERMVNPKKQPFATNSMPLPDFDKKIKDSYVVIIPNVYEHILERSGLKSHPRRWKHSLTLNNWIEIRDLLHKHKIKIIGFGLWDSCSEKHLKTISDQHYYFTEKDTYPVNNMIIDQLKWMKNAMFTVALGGAMHPHFVFNDLPIVGYDIRISKEYYHLIKQLKLKRNDLHFLENPIVHIIDNNLLYKEILEIKKQNKKVLEILKRGNGISKGRILKSYLTSEMIIKANGTVKDQIIDKIKEIL